MAELDARIAAAWEEEKDITNIEEQTSIFLYKANRYLHHAERWLSLARSFAEWVAKAESRAKQKAPVRERGGEK